MENSEKARIPETFVRILRFRKVIEWIAFGIVLAYQILNTIDVHTPKAVICITIIMIMFLYIQWKFWEIRKLAYDVQIEGNNLKFRLVDLTIRSLSWREYHFEDLSIPIGNLKAIYRIRLYEQQTDCYRIDLNKKDRKYFFVCGEGKSKLDCHLTAGQFRGSNPVKYMIPLSLYPLVYSASCAAAIALFAEMLARF